MGCHSDNLTLALGSTKQWNEQKSVGVIVVVVVVIINNFIIIIIVVIVVVVVIEFLTSQL